MGGLTDIHIRLTEADRVIAQVPNQEDSVLPHVGDRVHVGWSASAALFPAATEEADETSRPAAE